MAIDYCVISHTHWDREWCMPFEVHRIRLIDMINNLMDILDNEPEYRFHLDAQTIIVEDYLEVFPEKRDKLKGYIEKGRILIGPWYVQNDFFLTSGESTIRNLLIGSQMAESLGKCTWVGYAPDQFGNISQLPQIFSKFGIDSCIFGRGYTFDSPKTTEFIWKSENGSKVLAIHLAYWYNNAQRFPSDIDKSYKMIKNIKSKLSPITTTDHYLLMNGVDILEAQEDLLPILSELNKRLPENESICQCTMPEYVDKIRNKSQNLQEIVGEMRYGGPIYVLAGTLSSRVYLKQMNTYCQILIEKRLEPLYSFINMFGADEYPKHMMNYLWKLLIQNHPHDDICGCSCDNVHEHMVDRFKRFKEAGNELLNRGMEWIATYIDKSRYDKNQYIITAFNTSQRKRCGVLEVDIDFLEADEINAFNITDEKGKQIEFVVSRKRKKTKGVVTPINLPGVLDMTSFKIKLFIDEIDEMSFKSFIVTTTDRFTDSVKNYNVSKDPENILENEYLKVTISSNGTINLVEKESKKEFFNLLSIEESEDIGDSYVYRNNEDCSPITSTNTQALIECIEKNDLSTIYSVKFTMSVPEQYLFEIKRRSNTYVDMPVEIILRLDKGSKLLNIGINIENNAKDHRIRVLLPTGISNTISMAGSPFDVIERNKNDISEGILKVSQQPNEKYINIDSQTYGFAIYNKGLYEYENLFDEQNTIALTLLRGNGFIAGAGTEIPVDESWMVPGNQCLGKHTFELAVYPHDGNFFESKVTLMAEEFINPIYTYYHSVDEKKFVGGRAFVQDSDLSELFFREKKYPLLKLKMEERFFSIDSDRVVLSCVKLKEGSLSKILRVYNISKTSEIFNITFRQSINDAYIVNLKEERQENIHVSNNEIRNMNIGPKDILSIEII